MYIIGCDGERVRITSFSPAKIVFPRSDSANEAVPVSTKYKNNCDANIFIEWLRLREVQVPFLECGGLFTKTTNNSRFKP